jgi:hypothetical protein
MRCFLLLRDVLIKQGVDRLRLDARFGLPPAA